MRAGKAVARAAASTCFAQAEENVAVALATPAHTEASYRAYLSWYQPQTRCRLIYADMQPQPHVATPQDGYARYRDEALAGAVSQSYHRFSNTLDCSVNVFLFLACSLKCAG